MITPTAILQINATVIAGILVLLTIVTVGGDTTLKDLESQLELLTKKTEEGITKLTQTIDQKEQELSDKKNERETNQGELDRILSDKEINLKKAETDKKIDALKFEIAQYGETPQHLQNITSLKKESDDLFSMLQEGEEARKRPYIDKINSLNVKIFPLEEEINQLKQLRTEAISQSSVGIKDIKDKISQAIEETKLKENTLFTNVKEWIYFGGTPFTASAIFAIFISNAKSTETKFYRKILTLSLGSMAAGFAYLIVIFIAVNLQG